MLFQWLKKLNQIKTGTATSSRADLAFVPLPEKTGLVAKQVFLRGEPQNVQKNTQFHGRSPLKPAFCGLLNSWLNPEE